MEMQNQFTIPTKIGTAWIALLDIERIASCLPGASLSEVTNDDFTGNVKVKVGPVSIVYDGKAHFMSVDEESRVVVVEANGNEARGSGTAKALITAKLFSEASNVTRVEVLTDLSITGKAAQFGGGMIKDVASSIIDQFAANLATLLSFSPEAEADILNTTGSTSPAPEAKLVNPSATDSINLLRVAATPLLKRAIPALVGLVLVGLLVWLLWRIL
jgi:carbon monoxide dehydrogenase subunit G